MQVCFMGTASLAQLVGITIITHHIPAPTLTIYDVFVMFGPPAFLVQY